MMKFNLGDRVSVNGKAGYITNVKTFFIATNGLLMFYKEPIYRVYTLESAIEVRESKLTKF